MQEGKFLVVESRGKRRFYHLGGSDMDCRSSDQEVSGTVQGDAGSRTRKAANYKSFWRQIAAHSNEGICNRKRGGGGGGGRWKGGEARGLV